MSLATWLFFLVFIYLYIFLDFFYHHYLLFILLQIKVEKNTMLVPRWTLLKGYLWTIVFRPGPVQGSGSGFWLGLPGQIFFLKNNVVLVKKQKSTGCNQVFDRVLPGQPVGSAGSHRVFPSPIFSSTRPGSSPGSTRQAGPVLKLCCGLTIDLVISLKHHDRPTSTLKLEDTST